MHPVFMLMRNTLRKQINHGNAGNNQRQPQISRKIQMLFKHQHTDQGNQHNSQTAPKRIGYPHRHRLQGYRQQIKSAGIPCRRGQRRPKPGKLFGFF